MYATVIPLFARAVLDGTAVVVHGDGGQTRDFTFVSDVVAANLRAAEAPAERAAGRAFNIAGGRAYSLMEVLTTIESITGRTVERVFAPTRAGDVRHTRADCTAAARNLLHQPAVALEQGLARTVEWLTQG
jgi:UDP-glucose 4-epimerase